MSIKLTVRNLFSLRDSIMNSSMPIRADVYDEGTLGMPGKPCAYATGRDGITRVPVVYTMRPSTQEEMEETYISPIVAQLSKQITCAMCYQGFIPCPDTHDELCAECGDYIGF